MQNKHYAVLAASVLAAACSRESPPVQPAATTAVAEAAVTVPPITELQKVDVAKGAGEGISAGQQAVVHYTGWLYEPGAPDHKGKQFDSSRERGKPFRFTVGAGGVIKGWEEGVQGMQPGGRRQLVIQIGRAHV